MESQDSELFGDLCPASGKACELVKVETITTLQPTRQISLAQLYTEWHEDTLAQFIPY